MSWLSIEITMVSGSPILTLSATRPSTASPLNIFIEVDGMAAVATNGVVPSPLQKIYDINIKIQLTLFLHPSRSSHM